MKNLLKHIAFGQSKAKVFLFGGQGTHEKGMLNSHVDQTEFIKQISKQLDINFLQIGRPLLISGTSDVNGLINQTHITQSLLVLSHYLDFKKKNYHQALSENDFMIGHSLGQFSALTLANSISLIDALKLVTKRGQLMTKCTKQPHGMLIIKYKKTDQTQVFDLIKSLNLEVGCYNAQTNIIVPGNINQISNLNNQLKKIKIGSMKLPVSTAFHCKMLQQMEEEFKQHLQSIQIREPTCKILRNIDCRIYQNQDDIREGLLKQLTSPVQFCKSIKKIVQLQGIKEENKQQMSQKLEFIQIGGKRHITKFVQQIFSIKI